jgi:hypothetical protein
MSSRHGGYTASFTTGVATIKHFQQLQNVNVNMNMRPTQVRPLGRTEPSAYVNSQGSPVVTFQTRDIAAALGAAPLMTGKPCIDDGGAAAGAVFRYLKRSDYGTFETSTSHWTLISAQGFLFIDSLEADSTSDEGVLANMVYVPLSADGVTDPFVFATGVNLDAFGSKPDYKSVYYPGPVYLGDVGEGNTYVGPSNRIRISPGLNFTPEIEDGYTWPRVGVLRTRDPVFDINFVQGDIVPTTFAAGGAITDNPHGDAYVSSTAAVTVFLRKGLATTASGREPIGNTVHVGIEVDSTYIQAQSWSVAGEDDVNTSVSIRGAGSPTNAIFVTYLDSQIPVIP